MEKLLTWLQQVVDRFFKLTTAIFLSATSYITFCGGFDFSVNVQILWEIILVSFLCTLVSALLLNEKKRELSKKDMLVRNVIHFIIINSIVMLCGFWFKWFNLLVWRVAAMEVTIIVVFIIITATNYFTEYKVAEQMNEKLKERR